MMCVGAPPTLPTRVTSTARPQLRSTVVLADAGMAEGSVGVGVGVCIAEGGGEERGRESGGAGREEKARRQKKRGEEAEGRDTHTFSPLSQWMGSLLISDDERCEECLAREWTSPRFKKKGGGRF
eukprot:scaffold23537_cov22-Tisochrysis_lutea.AAC.1